MRGRKGKTENASMRRFSNGKILATTALVFDPICSRNRERKRERERERGREKENEEKMKKIHEFPARVLSIKPYGDGEQNHFPVA